MKLEHHTSTNKQGDPVEWDEKTWENGEECWAFFDGLIVKCTILEIDRHARASSPNGFLFYDLDEPIGHNLSGDELFQTPEEVACSVFDFPDELTELTEEEIKRLKKELEKGNKKYINGNCKNGNCKKSHNILDEVRERRIWFIAGTHAGMYIPDIKSVTDDIKQQIKEKAKDVFEYFDEMLKIKERGVDWFTLMDVEIDYDTGKLTLRKKGKDSGKG